MLNRSVAEQLTAYASTSLPSVMRHSSSTDSSVRAVLLAFALLLDLPNVEHTLDPACHILKVRLEASVA
ncbi:hypothetical protein XH93_12130 [Bradyrhizobium sp. CCBAU 51753]|nr:hypothetical protein XH93_12130 [Bradyrhizobium sp. CCBAU 51753]